LLLCSVAVYGLESLLTAPVGSLPMLSVMRFFTGIGIGGAFPGAANPDRRLCTCAAAGHDDYGNVYGRAGRRFLCGQLAGVLLPSFGWPSIYVVGGIVPLAMLLILWMCLPESQGFW